MSERGFYQGDGIALVDDKQRCAIPPSLRSTLAANSPRADGKDGGTIVIGVHEDQPCLVAYDPGYQAILKAELLRRVELSRGPDGKVDPNIMRSGPNGVALPFDGSGRFVMPGFQADYAHIGKQAFFWGTFDTIEIWDPKTLLETPGISPIMVAACRYHCRDKGVAL